MDLMVTFGKTLALVGMALLLGLFVVTVERDWQSTDEAIRTSGILASFPMDRLNRIKIESQGEETRLEHGKEGWRFLQPVKDRVDPERMSQVLEELGFLRIVEVIPQKEGRRGELGLKEPAAVEVQLDFERGLPDATLRFGLEGPVKDTAYVEVEGVQGRQEVYLVETGVRPWLGNPAESLRDRRILRWEAGKIERYLLRRPAGQVELRRDAERPRWYLERPLQTRANDDIAYSLLEELSQLEAEDFLEPGAFPQPGEIDGSTAIFRIWPEGEKAVTIWLRSEGVEEDSMLVRTSSRDSVFRVRDDLVERLPKTVNQLRYPYLLDIESGTAARILIRSRTEPDVILAHDGEGWKLFQRGEWVAANAFRIDRLLQAVNREPILEFRSDSASRLEDFGLERPFLELSVTTSRIDAELVDAYRKAREEAEARGQDPEGVPRPKPEVETRTVRFGESDPSDPLMNANLEGTPFIFGVDPALVISEIPRNPLKWRGTRLLSFNLLSVREIRMSGSGVPPLELDYDYLRNRWEARIDGEVAGREVDRRKAERLVRHLSGLEAEDWLMRRVKAYQALSRPMCRLEITLEGGERKAVLEFAPVSGPDIPAYYYGRLKGSPDVFLFPASSMARILTPVWVDEPLDGD